MTDFIIMKKNLKSESGIVTTDVVLSIIAIMIFSVLFISLMYNNSIENIKLKQEGLAIADITETFENIGIADYTDVTNENADSFIPEDVQNHAIKIDLEITQIGEEDILKKITATASYKMANKVYEFSMERMKIKE